MKGGSAAVLTKRIPSSHNPFILSHSILKELLQVQQSLGYCPQFDALFDELTAQEHLELYTRLRGIPWKDEERVGLWASSWQHPRAGAAPQGWHLTGQQRQLERVLLPSWQCHPGGVPTWAARARHMHSQVPTSAHGCARGCYGAPLTGTWFVVPSAADVPGSPTLASSASSVALAG